MTKVISVFGSAFVVADSEEYRAAYEVGQVLARSGYRVMNGGYDGIMGAVSRGAAEAGGHVIGVTVTEGRQEAERMPNPYLTERIHYESMRERLHHLVDHADGYIVMPGGIGTLQEVGEAWQLLRLDAPSPRPLIAYGSFWRSILMPLVTSPYVLPKSAEPVRFAQTPDDVVRHLREFFKS